MNCVELIKKINKSIAFLATFDIDHKFIGSGSGFIFWKSDIIVTCNHVIKGSKSVMVKFPDTDEFISAKTVLHDDEHDLALLKYDDEGNVREVLNIGNIEDIQEGMEVVFSGYPLGYQDLTTHQGIISSIIKDATGITSYLIDGTVNYGNSGCPLMDCNGNVIGVVNAKRWDSGNTLNKILDMKVGAISLHGVDLVEIYQALTNNVQLGVGAAVPASYIPEYKEIVSKNKFKQKGKK